MPAQSFFDPFFFVMLVIVASLAFIDFLLGEQRRKAIRERVGAWWVYLDDSTYAGLGADDAAKIHGWIGKWLGSTLSLRFAVLASIAMSIVYLIALFVALMAFESLFDGPKTGSLEMIRLMFEMIVDGRIWLLVASVILSVASLVVTLRFLRWMATSTSLARLFLLTLGDLFAILVLIVLTIVLVQSQRTMDVFDFDQLFDQIFWLAAGMTALTPLALHLLLSTIFMVSKLTSPLVKPPVSLILLRLEESEKGVLTLVGTGLGVVSKLAQEGLKLL